MKQVLKMNFALIVIFTLFQSLIKPSNGLENYQLELYLSKCTIPLNEAYSTCENRMRKSFHLKRKIDTFIRDLIGTEKYSCCLANSLHRCLKQEVDHDCDPEVNQVIADSGPKMLEVFGYYLNDNCSLMSASVSN